MREFGGRGGDRGYWKFVLCVGAEREKEVWAYEVHEVIRRFAVERIGGEERVTFWRICVFVFVVWFHLPLGGRGIFWGWCFCGCGVEICYMLALDAMSYSYEEVDLDFGGASEDFELAVLENAYRSGSMPRLTGVPPGAPVSVGGLPVATAVANVAHHPVAAGATTAAHGGVQEHPHLVDGDDLTHSALFAEGLEDFSSFPVNFAHLPVDGEHRRDEFDEDVKGDNGESVRRCSVLFAPASPFVFPSTI